MPYLHDRDEHWCIFRWLNAELGIIHPGGMIQTAASSSSFPLEFKLMAGPHISNGISKQPAEIDSVEVGLVVLHGHPEVAVVSVECMVKPFLLLRLEQLWVNEWIDSTRSSGVHLRSVSDQAPCVVSVRFVRDGDDKNKLPRQSVFPQGLRRWISFVLPTSCASSRE